MNPPKIVIDSRWGALGSLFVLQSYGFIMAYFFSEAIRQTESISSLSEIPDTIPLVVVGLVFFSAFLYAQGKVLNAIIRYLKEAKDLKGWFRDMASLQGAIRVILTLASITLYVGLFSGKCRFGLPKINIYILAAYQLFHPFASHFVASRLGKKEFKTRMVYRSAASQLGSFLVCMIVAVLFGGAGFALQRNHEPACWIFQTVGVGFGTMALVGFLLQDIKGREAEQIIDEDGRS